MKHLDLFSGIGGFALAARMVGGIETIGFCEIDPWARKVLAKNFQDIPIHDNVKTLTGNEFGQPDIISAGYPCQPFSHAGERKGENDDRHLWPEVCRILESARPTWFIGENVAGHVTLGLDVVLSDLERIGYACQPLIIPACAVNARHRRDRVWIIANSLRERGKRLRHELAELEERGQGGKDCQEARNLVFTDTNRRRRSGSGRSKQPSNYKEARNREAAKLVDALGRPTTSPIRGKFDGVSRRMDCDRLRGLGNAIVPQVAAEILRAITR